jgi:hypothetical protein
MDIVIVMIKAATWREDPFSRSRLRGPKLRINQLHKADDASSEPSLLFPGIDLKSIILIILFHTIMLKENHCCAFCPVAGSLQYSWSLMAPDNTPADRWPFTKTNGGS